MSHELKVTINHTELPIKEYKGQRVVTLKEIDIVHERPEGTARKRFNDNKKHFIEGTDYFVRNSDEAAKEFGIIAPNGLTLATESGYLMLVKSFQDNLAWAVQRQLVNTYFRVAQDTTKSVLAEAKLRNSRAREASVWLKIAKEIPVPVYREICAHYASTALAGKEVLPLPETAGRTYTATEVGKMLGGISAKKIGETANSYHLKTPEYGVRVCDKAKHCEKQVESWRYNERGIARLRELLNNN